jgi:hypothetical protein
MLSASSAQRSSLGMSRQRASRHNARNNGPHETAQADWLLR